MVQKIFLKTVQSVTVVVISQFLFSRFFRSRSHSKRDIYLEVFCSKSKDHASINIGNGSNFLVVVVVVVDIITKMFISMLLATLDLQKPSTIRFDAYRTYILKQSNGLSFRNFWHLAHYNWRNKTNISNKY